MEDFAIQDDKMYAASLRVRNTFIELVAPSPRQERCSSEPCSASDASVVTSKAELQLLANGNAKERVSCDSVVADDPVAEKSKNKDGEAKKRVIVRGLPCKVGCHRMKSELSALGLDGTYDAIEFPRQLNKRKGELSFLGYGFIDFTSEDAAVAFISKFANYRFDDSQSPKTVSVEFATSMSTPERQAKRSQRLSVTNATLRTAIAS
eukprot:TRINITY_DN12843_c0_g1_i2.p1 TRINITY_DN12843_c0_g1~~TRINITY_DN12843_c0_g1_i2.p1  ORF type:complete len:207 (+),score=36.23 TRINITY_DN12843_c0_g1_i2:72-692(+)